MPSSQVFLPIPPKWLLVKIAQKVDKPVASIDEHRSSQTSSSALFQSSRTVHDEREATQRVCTPSVILDGAGLVERLSQTQV